MDSTPLRIAFLTATFVTEPNSGGMGAYLHRLTKVLHELGHEPESSVARDPQAFTSESKAEY